MDAGVSTSVTTVLASFYEASYTKDELADLLARIVLGEAPIPNPPPKELLALQSPSTGGRGRPSADTLEERRAHLLQVIAEQFPEPFSIAEAAQMVGSAYQTVLRWQHEQAFLRTIWPEELREYFLTWTPRPNRVKLHPVWRGILDVHNYMLTVDAADKHGNFPRLPLYSMHGAMWSALGPARITARTLGGYNAIECARLKRPDFVKVLDGYDLPIVHFAGDPIPSTEPDVCLLAQDYLRDPTPPQFVWEAVALLELACKPQAALLADQSDDPLDQSQPVVVAQQVLRRKD
jgi:hypothetical protein